MNIYLSKKTFFFQSTENQVNTIFIFLTDSFMDSWLKISEKLLVCSFYWDSSRLKEKKYF